MQPKTFRPAYFRFETRSRAAAAGSERARDRRPEIFFTRVFPHMLCRFSPMFFDLHVLPLWPVFSFSVRGSRDSNAYSHNTPDRHRPAVKYYCDISGSRVSHDFDFDCYGKCVNITHTHTCTYIILYRYNSDFPPVSRCATMFPNDIIQRPSLGR